MVILFLLLGAFTVLTTAAQPDCEEKYRRLPNHTMCLEDPPNAVQVTLTQEVKDAIVRQHNDIRGAVQPTAANMQKMIWDDDLARVAAKWAMSCVGGHDKNRKEPGLPHFVGQNAYYGWPSFQKVVEAWGREVKDWSYEAEWSASTGHYIQEIYPTASRVGCGQATCGGSKPSQYICNYHDGTILGTTYKRGPPCSSCPDHCDTTGKLCDCGGKTCFNRGRLNLTTCQCQCVGRKWRGENCTEDPCKDIVCQHRGRVNPDKQCACDCPVGYSGNLCEICPEEDVFWCKWKNWKDKCNVLSNMHHDCSHHCKFC